MSLLTCTRLTCAALTCAGRVYAYLYVCVRVCVCACVCINIASQSMGVTLVGWHMLHDALQALEGIPWHTSISFECCKWPLEASEYKKASHTHIHKVRDTGISAAKLAY